MHSSQFTIHSSQFTIHSSQFTIHNEKIVKGEELRVKRLKIDAFVILNISEESHISIYLKNSMDPSFYSG